MSIVFSSLNVRGLKNNIKRKAIFLFCKEVKANLILLQVTHSNVSMMKNSGSNNGETIFCILMELLILQE